MDNEFKLVRAVEDAFRKVNPCAVEGCFQKLKDVLRKVQKAMGGNEFKLGHNKHKTNDDESDSDNESVEYEDSDEDDDEKPRALRPHNYKTDKSGETEASI